jgi:hypothetical protein
VLSTNSAGGVEENNKKRSVKIAYVPAEIRNRHLPDTKSEVFPFEPAFTVQISKTVACFVVVYYSRMNVEREFVALTRLDHGISRIQSQPSPPQQPALAQTYY